MMQYTGWRTLRLMIPPWRALNNPLVHYDVRVAKRAGRRPWTALILAYLTLIALAFFFALTLLEGTSERIVLLSEVLETALGFLVLGMVAMVIIGHWRLLMAVLMRTVKIVTLRRQRGDWDLIAITPVEKGRWLQAQVMALGWQVWPLVRQLIIVQTALVLIGAAFMLVTLHTERQDDFAAYERCVQNGNCYYTDATDYLHPVVFAIAALPVGLLLCFEPVIMTGVFALVGLNVSSRSRRPAMAMLYSLVSVLAARLVMAIVLVFGGFLISLVVVLLMNGLGMMDGDINIDLRELSDALFYIISYACMGMFPVALFIEWFPALGPLLLLTENETENYAAIYIIYMLTFGLTYVVVPLAIIRRMTRSTVARLNRRDF